MQELERQKLPDFTVPNAVNGKCQALAEFKIPVEKQHALEDERGNEQNNQPGRHARRVIRISHVKTIRQAHMVCYQAIQLRAFYQSKSQVGRGPP